jgi:hypothetical protein
MLHDVCTCDWYERLAADIPIYYEAAGKRPHFCTPLTMRHRRHLARTVLALSICRLPMKSLFVDLLSAKPVMPTKPEGGHCVLEYV